MRPKVIDRKPHVRSRKYVIFITKSNNQNIKVRWKPVKVRNRRSCILFSFKCILAFKAWKICIIGLPNLMKKLYLSNSFFSLPFSEKSFLWNLRRFIFSLKIVPISSNVIGIRMYRSRLQQTYASKIVKNEMFRNR